MFHFTPEVHFQTKEEKQAFVARFVAVRGSLLSETCLPEGEDTQLNCELLSQFCLTVTTPHPILLLVPSPLVQVECFIPSSGKGLRLSVLVLTVHIAMLCKGIYT